VSDSAARPPRLLLAATGSVGVMALPQYLMALRMLDEPLEVHVVMSDAAAHMLPPHSVAQFCDRVSAPGPHWQDAAMGHIEYADWPDLFAVAPASCDTLTRISLGLADKPIGLLAAAHQRPIMLCPNMNMRMWERPTMQRAMRTLADDGHLVVEPLRAAAFCTSSGDFEEGCIVPPPSRLAPMIMDEIRARRAA
jgi:phosphopantothenoylcysteine decarboxylase / phosphopantothenate---cysteine ligase